MVFRTEPLLGVTVGIDLALALGGGIELARSLRRCPALSHPLSAAHGA